MNPQNILWLLRVALRLLENFLSRRPPKERPATRADKVVERVAPLAEKVLDRVAPVRVAPEAQPAPIADEAETAPLPRSRRSTSLTLVRAVVLSAAVSGTAAYVI